MTHAPSTMAPLSATKRALLLQRLKQTAPARRSATDAAIRPVPRNRDLELSFAQERLWLAAQLAPDRSVYSMPAAVRLRGPLEVAWLEASLVEMVRRHETLRTTFAVVRGRPVQVIHPPAVGSLPVVDLRRLEPAARHRETARLSAREAGRPFDLETGPLFRACLLRLAAEEAVLLLNLHHVVADGWSLAIVVRELRALYEAVAAGVPSPLPELPVQYADFAAWQRGHLRGEALEEPLAYWRQRLGGDLPDLDLPTDRRRATGYGGGVEHELRLSPDLSAALSGLAREQATTLFMVLLAALKALLHRLSGQDDLLVGTPMADRDRAESEGLIGCFLNTLVLRTDVGGDPSFRDLLGRVKEVALGAFAHREIPFEKLLVELQPQRNAAAAPLFRVFFNMLSFPREEVGAGPLTVELLRPPDVGTKFDLTLYARETAEGVELRWLGAAALFSPARLNETARQLEHLLRQVAADPDVRLHDLSLVSPAARTVLPDPHRSLLCEWAGAVHERFAEQARRHPERVAVADRRRTWSYGALDAASDSLAAEIRCRGLDRQDVVAVFCERSASLALAVLGVWKSGAAFCLFDPAAPARRLVDRLRSLHPAAWLRLPEAPEIPAEVESAVAELVPAERRWTLGEALAVETAPPVAVDAADLAYVTFTSGTTGEPKGVLGTHRPLSHFLDWHAASFALGAEDRFGLLSGLAHDPLLRDLLTPLWLGAALHVPDPDILGTPGRLRRWMGERRITVAHLTPSLGRLLAPPEASAAPLAALRLVCFGGERLTRSTLAEVRALAPAARCVNFYGTTETPQAMGCHVVVPGTTPDGVVPLGHGIEGVQLLVLGRRGRLAGVGEVGEICVRTPYLASGYLGDATLTRERFVVNPYRDEAADRLYRTGDLGRFRPDGGVDYVGRADDQVKIRGFRVELGEIETVLTDHPTVLQAAVRYHDANGEAGLAAYVVLGGAAPADVGDLRGWLRDRLPAHMVPATFTTLPSLPLTANGKVDRSALPEPAEPADACYFVAPRDPREELMAGIWQEVLGVDRVGVHDDFFALGGHSLLATQASSRIRDVFGVELPLRRFFESPTLAALCRAVAAAGNSRPAAPRLARISRERPLPLSFAQQRLWFLDRLQPGGAAYNLAGAVRLEGRLLPGVLARSLSEIARRHETLRTTFDYRDGKPVQVIAAGGDVAVPEIDLSCVDAGRRQELERLMAAAAHRPFSLAHGPLLRALLLRLDAREHVLLLTFHHIVADGWSMGILIRELATLYEAFAAGAPAPLVAPPIQYADFAQWQRSWLQGEVLAGQLSYWRGQLAGLAPLELPADRPRPAVSAGRGARRTAALGSELAGRLRALGRRHGATLYMTLLGAFQALLSAVTGRRDVALGSPVAQRTRTEIEGLIGFFVNTLVLRTDLAGDPTFVELLGRVRRMTLEAHAHQDLPFEKLVEELDPHRDLNQSPLFQVMFILQNVPRATIELDGLTVRALPMPRQAAQFDWTLFVDEVDDDLVATLEYDTDLFAGTTIERLLRHYRTLLRAIVEAPERRLSELVRLGAGERHQLLREWNDTRASSPAACLHELVACQAAATPDAVAVAAGDACLSYRELERRSDRLARLLRAWGVEPEARVGLCVGRSAGLVVAILGILKAGGAYVPLDPTYPRERLHFTLEDAGIQVLVTESAWLELLPEGDWQTLALDRLGALPDEADGGESCGASPDRLAYVIYTSGSTGRPKGVQICHRTLLNFLESMRRRPGLAAGERLLAVTSLAFDIAGLELFLPLLTGATTVVARRELAADGMRLARELERREIRVMQATPATWRLLVRSGWSGQATLKMLSGGEALPRDLADELLVRGASLWNLYGPTETTVWSTLHRVHGGLGPLTIGRPIANTSIHLADRRLRPAAVGVTAELLIGGQGLARGYLARPALSAERFIPDPFATAPGARLYRTGDLARYRSDGCIEFQGRIDHQVKVRGFRIELGEIETALAAHAAVAETVVVAARGKLDDDRLVAYWVAAGDAAPSVGELRDFLKKTLPDPMVPSIFVELEALPLTPNGKIDRRGLPEPTALRPALEAAYVPPRSAVQELIAGIWREVLELDRIGIHDNFFDAGGHSLLMIEVQRRLQDALDREIPVIELFRYPSIDMLAGHLGDQETEPIAAADGRARAAARKAAGGRHVRARQARSNVLPKTGVSA